MTQLCCNWALFWSLRRTNSIFNSNSSKRPHHIEGLLHNPHNQDHAAVRRLPDSTHLRRLRVREGFGDHHPEDQPQQTDHDHWAGAAAGLYLGHLYCGEDWEEGGSIYLYLSRRFSLPFSKIELRLGRQFTNRYLSGRT